jgi:hypothetical protein
MLVALLAKSGITVDPLGCEIIAAAKVSVSDPPEAAVTPVTSIDTEFPIRPVNVLVVFENVEVNSAALAGTTVSKPKPNADTATSAMRLIDVFVDIIFLSKVIRAYFARTAWVLETGS